MKKFKIDWELFLVIILAFIPFWLIYKIFQGIYNLIDKLIDKI